MYSRGTNDATGRLMKDRHIVITGSSSGIGRATAERLLEEGVTVIGIARQHEKFEPNTDNYKPIKLDLENLDTLHEKIKEVLLLYPQLDGIVCNAGTGQFANLENFSPQQIHSYITSNLIAPMILIRTVLPHFKLKKRGDIIIIGSEAALKGAQKGSLYCAAKFGLRGFAQAIREETANKGIRVSLVNPGMVRTQFFNKLAFSPGTDADNAIEPEDVATTISHILAMRGETVIDEINLTPLKKVLIFDE